jgi:hypothetical protein
MINRKNPRIGEPIPVSAPKLNIRHALSSPFELSQGLFERHVALRPRM